MGPDEAVSCGAGVLSQSSRDSRQSIAVKAWPVEHEPGLAEEIFVDLDPPHRDPARRAVEAGAEPGHRPLRGSHMPAAQNRSHEFAAEYRHAESVHTTILCARLTPAANINIASEWQRCDLFPGLRRKPASGNAKA
jgi:hypothetical protein